MTWNPMASKWTPPPPEVHIIISGRNRALAIEWINKLKPAYAVWLVPPDMKQAQQLGGADIRSWSFYACTEDEMRDVIDSGMAEYLASRIRGPR